MEFLRCSRKKIVVHWTLTSISMSFGRHSSMGLASYHSNPLMSVCTAVDTSLSSISSSSSSSTGILLGASMPSSRMGSVLFGAGAVSVDLFENLRLTSTTIGSWASRNVLTASSWGKPLTSVPLTWKKNRTFWGLLIVDWADRVAIFRKRETNRNVIVAFILRELSDGCCAGGEVIHGST